MVSNGFSTQNIAAQAVRESLDICLACKGCKAECPSAVDMAKLKYEFYQHYYALPGHHHPVRDYVFGYISQIAKLSHPLAPLGNIVLSAPLFAGIRENLLGLSRERTLPQLARISFQARAKSLLRNTDEPDCLLLSDAFNEYFFPATSMDGLKVLLALGCKVKILSTLGAGRSLISKGFLTQAKKHTQRLVDEISKVDPDGRLPVVGLEPSEIYTLKDEFIDFLPNDPRVEALAQRAYMLDEYLIRPGNNGNHRLSRFSPKMGIDISETNVLLHGHCYQKAQPPAKDGFPTGVAATAAMLKYVGYSVTTIDDGCCGMAGAFGYETEHYAVSMKVGELALLPAIRKSERSLIAASGISCQSQILDGTGRQAYHPISLVARRLEQM
jgi:Fe-S oxidoreductase